MSGIVWVASYPKSGNTWLRVFLANLRADAEVPADINALPTVQFSTRELFDRATGWKSSDLSAGEIAALRMPVQRTLAAQPGGIPIKTHELFCALDGAPRFAADATRAALYVVRNPLDVVVSLSHYWGKRADTVIAFMNNPSAQAFVMPGGAEFEHALGDWSMHVRSWVDAPGLNVCVVRYEDMLASPELTFARAATAAAGSAVAVDKVQRALWHSRFDELRRQEAAKGFGEGLGAAPFFRRGRSGEWRETLSSSQAAAIIEAHGAMMQRFGYLGSDGAPF